MKKLLCLFIVCMMALTLFAGCTQTTVLPAPGSDSKTTPAAATKPPKAQTPVTLKLLSTADEAKAMPQLLKKFNETYPNVSIESIIASTPDQYNSIMAAKIAAKDVPDLLLYQAGAVTALYASQGIITDLTDTGFIDRISAGDKSRYSYKSRVFSVPLVLGVAGIIVNTDVMKKYGVTEIPKTLKEFIEICEKFKKAGLESPVIVGGKELSPASQYVYQSIYLNIYGKNPNWYIDVLEGKNSWNGPEMQRIIDGYASFKQYINKDTLGLDLNGAIRRLALGEGAYLINNASGLVGLRAANPDGNYMVIPPPWTMEGTDTLANSDYDNAISISSSTKYPVESLAFVDFLTSKEGAAIFNNATKTFPSVLGAKVDLDPALTYVFKNYIDNKKSVGFYSRQWVPGVQDVMKKSVQDWLGGLDKTTALDFIEKEHKRLMQINAEYVKDFLHDNPRH
ncbi:ABC transporter substrate-binding protein [Paenibacillus agricola]|uniref:Extracellular solute-binding protein n=1 Tax=Paenibacillus agricola TaxID=2716264 RepID=A0ABX0JAT9_9BACL|nr:extracellular solute-binding protein [Paenibacillus agricola]NHN32515.1 extracellular solute-binding protein [Paenibacillus agricola]